MFKNTSQSTHITLKVDSEGLARQDEARNNAGLEIRDCSCWKFRNLRIVGQIVHTCFVPYYWSLVIQSYKLLMLILFFNSCREHQLSTLYLMRQKNNFQQLVDVDFLHNGTTRSYLGINRLAYLASPTIIIITSTLNSNKATFLLRIEEMICEVK